MAFSDKGCSNPLRFCFRRSSKEFDTERFSSRIAWEKYLEYMKKSKTIFERGFETDFGGDDTIRATVELFGWSPFCLHLVHYVSQDLCYEFFAYLSANRHVRRYLLLLVTIVLSGFLE